MDWEHKLVQKVVETSDITSLVDSGIGLNHFKEEMHREVYQYILDDWNEYGAVPTAESIQSHWPNYVLEEATEPLAKCIDEVKWLHRRSLTLRTIADASASLKDDDIDAAINRMASGIQTIEEETSVLVDEDLMLNIDARQEEYMLLSENAGELLGMPTGFPSIDAATSGFQPEQFIILIATPKTGKSLFAMRMGLAAHENGHKVLFIGFEMSNREQRWRFDSMTTGTSYDAIVQGKLSAEQEERFFKRMQRYADDANSGFILSSDINSGTTVSGVKAKIEHYKPDLVIIDGMYFMDDESGEHPKGSPQALTSITRGIKRVAQKCKVPILGTTQALVWKSQKGLDMNSIGYTSSFAQDADVIMGISKPDEDVADELLLSIIRARNTGSMEVTINADWTTYEFTENDGSYMEEMAQFDEGGIQD